MTDMAPPNRPQSHDAASGLEIAVGGDGVTPIIDAVTGSPIRVPALPPINTTNLASRWTRACWWLSRRLGGRSIFGKADFT